MSYPTKLQCIERKDRTRQFYVNIPAPLAEALDCRRGEIWRWTVADRRTLILEREQTPELPRGARPVLWQKSAAGVTPKMNGELCGVRPAHKKRIAKSKVLVRQSEGKREAGKHRLD